MSAPTSQHKPLSVSTDWMPDGYACAIGLKENGAWKKRLALIEYDGEGGNMLDFARLLASAPALLAENARLRAALETIERRAVYYPRNEMAKVNAETARAALAPTAPEAGK